MVVLFHLNLGLLNIDNGYVDIVKYGWLGVPIFFVISGFCIMTSATHSHNTPAFFVRRFFRIYPAYWVSLLVVLGAAVFQKLATGTNSVANIPQTPLDILANLSLITWPLSRVNIMNYVYWSLTCEVLFYLIIGASILVKGNYRPLLLLIFSAGCIFVPIKHTGILFFIDNWPAFGCGIGLYYFFYHANNIQRLLSWALLATNLAGLYVKFMGIGQPEYIIVTLATIAIIFASQFIKTSETFLSALGEHSYTVYLIHVPVGVFILGRLKVPYIQQHPLVCLLYDLGVYSIVSVIAWQLFKHVEKPLINYGKRVSKKLVKPTPAQ